MPPLESAPRVIVAPDWRDGVPYQQLLGEALERRGVALSYLRHYRRLFPLWRLLRAAPPWDLLHLHWPEAYYPRKGDAGDWFRCARFPLDLRLALGGRALAVTAHNLHAHNRADESFAQRNTRAALQMASVVFAHSEPAKELLVETYALDPARIAVIPHGDLSVVLGPPLPSAEARAQLGLAPGPLGLVFGAVEPYKGLEEILETWSRRRPPAVLAIAGKPSSAEYGAEIAALAARIPGVIVRLGWMDDAALRQWLSACDAVLFNYHTIFTSGAANLARAYGVPQLLPARLKTVVLDEPNPRVLRFRDLAEDWEAQLQAALAIGRDYEAAAEWRRATAWDRVAERTAEGYRQALSARPRPAGWLRDRLVKVFTG